MILRLRQQGRTGLVAAAAVAVAAACALAWFVIEQRSAIPDAPPAEDLTASAPPPAANSVNFAYAPRADEHPAVELSGEVVLTRRRDSLVVVSMRGIARLDEAYSGAEPVKLDELYAALARPTAGGWQVSVRSTALPVGEKLTREENTIVLALMRFEIPLDGAPVPDDAWVVIAGANDDTVWYAHAPEDVALAALPAP